MATTVTFAATVGDRTETRTSGTMPYVAVSAIVDDKGVGAVFSWHKTYAAAHQAARTGYTAQVALSNGKRAVVLPATPTKVNGKVTDEFQALATTGWGDIPAEVMAKVIASKTAKADATDAPAVKTAKAHRDAMDVFIAAKAPRVVPTATAADKDEIKSDVKTIDADAKKTARRERRAARRAAETTEAKEARLAKRRTARKARKARKAAAQ